MKKHRFKARETYKQLKEVDYLDKLSESEKEWLEQFFMEYYQADFNYEEPIHPNKLRKDCQGRNNSSKRQMHAIGNEKLKEFIVKSIERVNKGGKQKSKYYSILDYDKDYQEYQEDTED